MRVSVLAAAVAVGFAAMLNVVDVAAAVRETRIPAAAIVQAAQLRGTFDGALGNARAGLRLRKRQCRCQHGRHHDERCDDTRPGGLKSHAADPGDSGQRA